jgi:hypothetical protein
MRFTLLDVSLPLLGAISFVLLAWASFRRIYAGRELPGYMKKTLFYGFFFALGMCYVIMFAGGFNWPDPLLFAAIGAWGILLGAIAWSRYRLSHAAGEKSAAQQSVSTSSSGNAAGK